MFGLKKLTKQVADLKEDSHPPVDIAPRIYDELDRMLLLGRLFYDVPSEDLLDAASAGLESHNSNPTRNRR